MIINGIERSCIIHDDFVVKGFFEQYRFLSNFEVCDVYFDGNLYGSSEAAYMAGKTMNPTIREQFQKHNGFTPKDARMLGRSIEIRSDWDEIRYDHMAAVVFDKFSRNKDLRGKLLATGNKYLEETNWWKDKFWGVCDGEGESNLGRILMATREFWKTKKENEIKITKLF